MQLTLEGIRVSRGVFLLQAEGSFTQGIHLLTGRIGSGKSTLGEVISRVLLPDSGHIVTEGITTSILSMQFPEYHITTSTTYEEIRSWGLKPPLILEEAGLSGRGDDDLLNLSRGELKRLHLACLLGGSYDLMVMDEPFAGLDDEARYWISSRLEEFRDRIVIIISHDITTLPGIDHLWEMQNGLLTSIGHVPEGLTAWRTAPPLIRYLLDQGISLPGLSWKDLAEAACRIPG